MKLMTLISLAQLHYAVAANIPASTWATLNQTLSGQLVALHPPALPCHQDSYAAADCAVAKANWFNSSWRSDQIGAMEFTTWEQLNGQWCTIGNVNDTSPIADACAQGDIPSYGVNVTSAQHIVDAFNFASTHALNVVVKGQGHDLLGRSTNPNSLLIWTHNLKNISVAQKTTICGTSYDNAITAGAGVHWGQVYATLAAIGRIVPGGGDPDVGASGGQPQGGGHSPLGNTFGMTPDSIIEFTVVTPTGRILVVNECNHSDLFWAMRGGGGGTYAVALSTTYKTYLDAPTVYTLIEATVTDEGFENVVRQVLAVSQDMANVGWSGYFYGLPGTAIAIFFNPLIENRTIESVNATIQPLFTSLPLESGVTNVSASFVQLPSFAFLFSSGILGTSATGIASSLPSRLIPKATIADPDSRDKVISAWSAIQANRNGTQSVLGCLVSGGPVTSTPNPAAAVNPAWREALWHLIYTNLMPEGVSAESVQANFDFGTAVIEPLRQLTPGSGAYMNEADPQAVAWKEDFFGKNYDRLLTVKTQYDPKFLLKCNRCVGSDL